MSENAYKHVLSGRRGQRAGAWGLTGMLSFSLSFFSLALSLSSCRPAEVPNRAALADTLKAVVSQAYDFSKPGVAKRMNDLFAPSGQVVSSSGGQIVSSRDSIAAGIARFWENVGQNMRDPVWKWGEVFVEPLGSEGATLTASWSIPHTAPNGQPHVIEGAWTAVFKRTDAGWKIVQEHLSAR